MHKKLILQIFILITVVFIAFEIIYLKLLRNEKANYSITNPVLKIYDTPKSPPLKTFKKNDPFFQTSNDKWSFIFIGFTQCPDVCPMSMSLMSKLFKNFEKNNFNHFEGHLISIDFKNDNPKKVQNYTQVFHPKIKGHYFEQNIIDPFIEWIGGSYSTTDNTISHSSSIFIMDPNGMIVGEFINPINGKKMSEHFLEYRKNKWHSLKLNQFKFLTSKSADQNILGGYLSIQNMSETSYKLNQVNCHSFKEVQLHDLIKDDVKKTVTMIQKNSVSISSEDEFSFTPGGAHLMAYTQQDFASNDQTAITCQFHFDRLTLTKIASIEYWK